MADQFQTRIRKNNQYYDKFATNVAARTDKRNYDEWMQAFCENLPPNGLVLDIGCGTGIHLRMFCERGYQVLGVDPSSEMRKLAAEDGIQVLEGTFETLLELELPSVSGVWCAGTLLHVPKENVREALRNIWSVLEYGGPLFLTVRLGSSAKWDRYDEADGEAERFIQLFEEEFLNAELAACGFEVLLSKVEESYWGRPALWISLIARKIKTGE